MKERKAGDAGDGTDAIVVKVQVAQRGEIGQAGHVFDLVVLEKETS